MCQYQTLSLKLNYIFTYQSLAPNRHTNPARGINRTVSTQRTTFPSFGYVCCCKTGYSGNISETLLQLTCHADALRLTQTYLQLRKKESDNKLEWSPLCTVGPSHQFGMWPCCQQHFSTLDSYTIASRDPAGCGGALGQKKGRRRRAVGHRHTKG